MSKTVIPIEFDYDLDLTLYPSFTLVFFEKVRGKWVKVLGKYAGLKFSIRKGVLEANIGDEDVVLNLSGLWFDPKEYLKDVKREFRDVVSKVVEVYRKLRLAINPYDREAMFVTVVLSQRTSFHVNVIKWVRKIFEKENFPDFSVSRSYQVERAKEAYKTCIKVLKEDREVTISLWNLRKSLLSKCRNVGVKTADAYLLFTRRNATFLAPADTHFHRFIWRMFLVKKETPRKNYCIKTSCEQCPLLDKCITGWAMKIFGKLAGWVQTVAYVHDKKYCFKNKCSICPLKHICKYYNKVFI